MKIKMKLRFCSSCVREVSARLTSAVKPLDQKLATSGSFSQKSIKIALLHAPPLIQACNRMIMRQMFPWQGADTEGSKAVREKCARVHPSSFDSIHRLHPVYRGNLMHCKFDVNRVY